MTLCKHKKVNIKRILLITGFAVIEIVQLICIAMLVFMINGREPVRSINIRNDRLTYSRGDYEVEFAKKDYPIIKDLLIDFTISIPDPTYDGRGQYDSDTINIYYANGEKDTITLKNGFGYNGKRYGRVVYNGKWYLADPWMVDVYEAALEDYREDYYKYLKSLDN